LCGRPAAEKMGIFWPRAMLKTGQMDKRADRQRIGQGGGGQRPERWRQRAPYCHSSCTAAQPSLAGVQWGGIKQQETYLFWISMAEIPVWIMSFG